MQNETIEKSEPVESYPKYSGHIIPCYWLYCNLSIRIWVLARIDKADAALSIVNSDLPVNGFVKRIAWLLPFIHQY